MRGRIITTFLSSFVLAAVAAAHAQPQTDQTMPPPPPVEFPADARIAFVDLQAVLQNAALGRAGQAKLKALSDQKTTDLAEKDQALQALEQEVQSGQNVLAASALQQKTADLDRARREFQFLQEQARVDYDALQSQLLDEFGQKVLPIIENIRAERNLWAILSPGEGAGPLAVDPALDLSAEVVRRLDTAE